jgi:hypothetical protein
MPIPPDTDPGSQSSTDAFGRRLATPPELLPPRLPSVPVPRRARRGESNEVAVTTRLERIEPEPAPLPPSPADAEASRWLARSQQAIDAPDPIGESSDATRPVVAPTRPPAPVRGHSSAFTFLLAVTMLAVGMVIGALLAGR